MFTGLSAANAATVVLDEVGAFTGFGSITYNFTTPLSAIYTASLYDIGALVPGSGTPFVGLEALISPSAQLLMAQPGAGSSVISFFATAGSAFTVHLDGFAPSGLLTGKYALNVQTSAVPLPMSVPLLGTALTGMVMLGRRKKT
jgi:hypothetical protein